MHTYASELWPAESHQRSPPPEALFAALSLPGASAKYTDHYQPPVRRALGFLKPAGWLPCCALFCKDWSETAYWRFRQFYFYTQVPGTRNDLMGSHYHQGTGCHLPQFYNAALELLGCQSATISRHGLPFHLCRRLLDTAWTNACLQKPSQQGSSLRCAQGF